MCSIFVCLRFDERYEKSFCQSHKKCNKIIVADSFGSSLAKKVPQTRNYFISVSLSCSFHSKRCEPVSGMSNLLPMVIIHNPRKQVLKHILDRV